LESGVSDLIPNYTPWDRNNPVYNLKEDFNWIKGKHTIQIGGATGLMVSTWFRVKPGEGERKALITERVRHSNRIKGLLFAQGISKYEPLRRDRRARLAALRTGDGRELPAHLKAQISRELDRLELLLEQLKAVEAERDALLAQEQVHANAPAGMLLKLKGIGPEFAAILWSEGLFRHYDNRRQLAAYAGLAPTPWQSGQIDREQGVSKAGNPRLRVALIQLSWLWLQHQSQSALARWFEARVARNGGRLRKSTIVALARKLLVALWKYVNAGVAIEGAVLAS